MFTLHHGLWIYFLTHRHPRVWQFVAGSMFPDYVYIVLMLVMLWQGQLVFGELLHLSPTTFMTFLPLHPWAVQIDLMGHSVVFWAVAQLLTLAPTLVRFQAFVVGWGTHLLVDELTHGAHANFLFYPLSLQAVHSPISYWETEYFAHEFKMVNGTLLGIIGIYLAYHWWRKRKVRNDK